MLKSRVVIHTEREILGIKASARATAWVLDELCRQITPGLTTLEVDRLAAELIRETGGQSAFCGYRGFPGQVCISVNDEVVHGIGRLGRVLALGDLVSIDVGIRLNGFVGDCAATVCAGRPAAGGAKTLMDATRRSLEAGIAATRSGNCVNDISKAVESVVRRAGFSVVRDFVGHGCGCELHEPPEVPNFAQPQRGPRLQAGMVLAIEPMVNAGTGKVTVAQDDGWTVRTADGGLSAHFEHMVLIRDDNPEILTWPRTA